MEATSVDRDPQNEAHKNIEALEEFIKLLEDAEASNEDGDVDVTTALHTLRWHLKISRVHYRNLLHCYAIHERGSRKKTK